jgi:GNAT superfamily N-acetyltransferase
MTTPCVAIRSETLHAPCVFQQESWDSFYPEAAYLFPMNYAELSTDKATIPLDVRVDEFAELDKKGILHIVSARCESKIVGYHISGLLPHMHYKSSGLMAYTDVYFLHPDHRFGGNGAKMLMEVERTLAERGIRKFYISTKVHSDNSALLEKMGYRWTDKIYTKLLGS